MGNRLLKTHTKTTVTDACCLPSWLGLNDNLHIATYGIQKRMTNVQRSRREPPSDERRVLRLIDAKQVCRFPSA